MPLWGLVLFHSEFWVSGIQGQEQEQGQGLRPHGFKILA